MNKQILVDSQSEDYIRCSHCLEIKKLAYEKPQSFQQYCSSCACLLKSSGNYVLLSIENWHIYQVVESIEHGCHFRKIAAQKLNMDYTKVCNRILWFKSLGLSVKGAAQRKYQFSATNSNGELIKLSKTQDAILKLATSEKMLLREPYVVAIANQLNLSQMSVRKQIEKLRNKGILVPTSEERRENLKQYVKQQICLNANLPRSTLVRKLQNESGSCCSSINKIIRSLEQEGLAIKRGALWEEILEVLLSTPQPIKICQIHKKYFPLHAYGSVVWAINDLLKKGLIFKTSEGVILKGLKMEPEDKQKLFIYPGSVEYECHYCGKICIPRTFFQAKVVCAECCSRLGLNPQPLPIKDKPRKEHVPKHKAVDKHRINKILEVLASGPLKTPELVQRMGICKTSVMAAIRCLEAEGSVVSVKCQENHASAWWALPEHKHQLEEKIAGRPLAERFLAVLQQGTTSTTQLSKVLRISSFDVHKIGAYLACKYRVTSILVGDERFYTAKNSEQL